MESGKGRMASLAAGEREGLEAAFPAALPLLRRRGAPGRGAKRFGLGPRRLDLPRTYRARLLLDPRLRFRRRRPRPSRLFVLLDVSASMDRRAGRYLPLLAGLVRQGGVRVFAFSSEVCEVTRELREQGMAALADRPFGRGTRLGTALQALLDLESGPSPRDDVLIISDGWEAGERDTLVAALLALRRRSRRLLWWNPDAALPGFTPTAFVMRLVVRLADALSSGLGS